MHASRSRFERQGSAPPAGLWLECLSTKRQKKERIGWRTGAGPRGVPHHNLPSEGQCRAPVKHLCVCGCLFSLLFGFSLYFVPFLGHFLYKPVSYCGRGLQDIEQPSRHQVFQLQQFNLRSKCSGKAVGLHTSHGWVPACDVGVSPPPSPRQTSFPKHPAFNPTCVTSSNLIGGP